jgi:aconitase A
VDRKAKDAKTKKTVEVAFPDTVVGTDSHTTMINGLACWAGAWAASRRKLPCWASHLHADS